MFLLYTHLHSPKGKANHFILTTTEFSSTIFVYIHILYHKTFFSKYLYIPIYSHQPLPWRPSFNLTQILSTNLFCSTNSTAYIYAAYTSYNLVCSILCFSEPKQFPCVIHLLPKIGTISKALPTPAEIRNSFEIYNLFCM